MSRHDRKKGEGRPAGVTFTPIGIVHSPHRTPGSPPFQSAFSPADGSIELFPEFREGLLDLDGFSRLTILYWFDRAQGVMLTEKPLIDGTQPHGIFSTRHFNRPNPIGISHVTLKKIEGTTLILGCVDMLDGTPVLDIKPYIPSFDSFPEEKTGWVAETHLDCLRKESMHHSENGSEEITST
ncbi:MAG: tRNA (N6-threonylcarbamoyladenosine(37)-N6)-methyltransferase TrmO [Methanoregulaceae archaeon]